MDINVLLSVNEFSNQIAFIIAAFIGGLAHYLKKMLRKETDVPMNEWFGSANLPATIYTGIVFTFVLIGALAGGIITSATSFWAALYTGFATGFAIDSGFNSDSSITSQLNTIKSETSTLLPVVNKPVQVIPSDPLVKRKIVIRSR